MTNSLKLRSFYALVFILLAGITESAKATTTPWVEYLNCYDIHGNQMVVDIDVQNNRHFQIVLRPTSAYGKPSVVTYFAQAGHVYSQAQYKEIIIGNVAKEMSAFATFMHSDSYMTVRVNVDNMYPTGMVPFTAAKYSSTKNGQKLEWIFNSCSKRF